MNNPRFVMFQSMNRVIAEHNMLLSLFVGGIIPGGLVGDRTTGLVLNNDGEWVENPQQSMP